MKSTRRKSKIAGLFLALLVLITTLGAFAVTAFAADGDTAAVTVIEGYGPDSDDSEFGTALENKIISGTNNGTSWIDDTGKGNLYFQWGYGDSLDVALIDPNGVISYESVIIQEHSDPEMRYDAHWMEFALSGACADDTYIVAIRGFNDYYSDEISFTRTGSVANVFTQTASGDPSFLSNDMLMYGEDYITDGSTSLSFKLIPATFRFVITNTHEEALSLESVTLRVLDADGNSSPVASQHCMIYTEAQMRCPEITYSEETYDSITTNLSGYTLEVGDSYLAYALALPLQFDDALTSKTIQVEVTTSEGQCIAFELAAEDIANANPNNKYNWVGEKSYTFRVGTRCADGCTLNATGNCTVCGYECIHDYDNGFCTVCDAYEPAIDSDSDGYYEIASAGQLFWFANHVNTMDRTASAVLVADIDLENRPWTPIGVMGEDSNSFHGVFDGQYHTITGLNVTATSNGAGFFGEVRTGTVKNFTIYGEVVVNAEVDYVGGVIGSICGVNGETDLERNGAIIQNITSYVNVTAKAHGIGMIGGFVGYADHQSLIEKCSWYGTFDAGSSHVDNGAGGFIGKTQENTSEVTIRNCAAYGTIKTNYAGDYNNTATIYMGGFLGLSDTGAQTTLENCLFAGRFERGENLTDQAFLGAFGTLRSVNAIKNCYYLGDDGLEAVHSNSDLKPGSDNVEITSVTKAQLLSGEVAYKLGEHFGQILEGENRQSYPVLGGEAVPSSRFEIYGQQLNIGGDLSMKYYVMGYAPEFNSKGLYMEFSHNGVKTKVYAGEPNADGFYVFVLEGINPQCMGDSIRAMLYYNETEVTSHGCEDGKEYSVEKNLLNLLEKYKDDAALVALINDTLAYGKAASEYKKHDTMTGDYTVSDSTIPDATVTPNGAFTGYTVVFGQVNFIKVSVALETGYTLYLDGTDITSQLVGGIFKTDGIAPTEFDKKFSFEIKNGDTSVQTFAVSVNDYIGAQKDSATMGNLVKALYTYGVSAQEYAASQNN